MLGKHLNTREAIRKDKQATKSLKWKKESGAKNYEGTNQAHSIIITFFNPFRCLPDFLIFFWLTPDDFNLQKEMFQTGKGLNPFGFFRYAKHFLHSFVYRILLSVSSWHA